MAISLLLILAAAVSLAQAAVQTTQPADTPINVYVAPLSESGSLIRPGWLSSRFTGAIQNNLDQIKQVALVTPTTAAPNASTTIGEILTSARKANAEVAVIGVVHAAADKLSVSGNIYDVSSGSSFGNFKASGTTQDLFAIQDSVTRQIHIMVARLAQPPAELSQTLANAGSSYEGSALQASVNNYDLRGLHLSNAASTNYQDQPYHVVEQSSINFPLPYYEGGYGYHYYGWPSYTYYPSSSPYYSSPFYLGWGYWPTSGHTVIIINQSNGHRAGSRSYHGGDHAMSERANQIPPKITTRNQNISHVATPMPNTIQHSPSYEIRYGPNTIQKSPSYEIRPVQR